MERNENIIENNKDGNVSLEKVGFKTKQFTMKENDSYKSEINIWGNNKIDTTVIKRKRGRPSKKQIEASKMNTETRPIPASHSKEKPKSSVPTPNKISMEENEEHHFNHWKLNTEQAIEDNSNNKKKSKKKPKLDENPLLLRFKLKINNYREILKNITIAQNCNYCNLSISENISVFNKINDVSYENLISDGVFGENPFKGAIITENEIKDSFEKEKSNYSPVSSIIDLSTASSAPSNLPIIEVANFNYCIDNLLGNYILKPIPKKRGRKAGTKNSKNKNTILTNENEEEVTELKEEVIVKRDSHYDKINQKNNEEKAYEHEKEWESFFSEFEKVDYEQLEVKESKIHGLGIFAKKFIPLGSVIMKYEGELIGKCVSDKREKIYQKQGIQSIYMFKIDEDLIIDSTLIGNKARYINHSCLPNCYSTTHMPSKSVVYISECDIKEGQELTINYHFSEKKVDEVCNCGAPNCRSKTSK